MCWEVGAGWSRYCSSGAEPDARPLAHAMLCETFLLLHTFTPWGRCQS